MPVPRSLGLGPFRGERAEVRWPLTPERLLLALVGSVQQHYFNPVPVEQRACGQQACQGRDGAQEDAQEHRWGQRRAAAAEQLRRPSTPDTPALTQHPSTSAGGDSLESLPLNTFLLILGMS